MTFLLGFGVGISLIVAIGAQNIWVLSQSMAGANRLIIAAVCIVCDSLLIVLGVFAVHHMQQLVPPLVPLLTWLGVALLVWLAWHAARRAWRGGNSLQADTAAQVMSNSKTAVTALAITLLNPHVYLDTVFLIGGVANQQATPLWFMLGACTASLVWFSSLTALAPKLKIWLNSARRWQLFDGAVAILLSGIALNLALY
ncbi:LysE family transporter [Alkalimonas sp. NCh-2]|uniref:LysE/ArgO family amino acid transporter n=1 Tax=Alkalimonas sp. NCh-2 TaxID=3144846 RepID=UPI0031F70885